jgi:hypothetical protein
MRNLRSGHKPNLEMKNIFYLLVLIAFTLASCDKNELYSNLQTDNNYTANKEENGSRAIRPVILGEQKENPFSLKNVKITLDTLKKIVNESDQTALKAKAVDDIELKTTDLYVRFLPQDSAQYKQLKSDTTLTLFDFPLDYEIKQSGDYYQDPTLKAPFTWYYTTVKSGYVPPVGIKYEVLQELFIAENSEYYSEEPISEAENVRQSAKRVNSEPVDPNIFNALYAISFKLTGNEKELKQDTTTTTAKSAINGKSSIMKVTIPNCTRYTIKVGWWKVSWTSCDPYYYPDGYIKVNTPNGDVGVKGAKVRMWRWFCYADARTDANGYYYCNSRFNSLWIGNCIDYHIILDGVNGDNSWTLSKSLFGILCLWTDYYGAGFHDPNGWTMTFYTNSDYWGKCVLSNAIYDYCDIARNEGISLPSSPLDIANKESDDLTSSAPLLKNHFNFSLLYALPTPDMIIATLSENIDLVHSLLPDLILRYSKTLTDYNTITAIVWHELTHSSQLERMKSEKGYWWASAYWSANIYQQAANSITSGSPYGSKGDSHWQQIALSEGWANYREWVMASKYLSYSVSLSGFQQNYAYMFNSLNIAGCTYSDMESSLCTYSVSDFRDKLIAKYPSLQAKIILITNAYL